MDEDEATTSMPQLLVVHPATETTNWPCHVDVGQTGAVPVDDTNRLLHGGSGARPEDVHGCIPNIQNVDISHIPKNL